MRIMDWWETLQFCQNVLYVVHQPDCDIWMAIDQAYDH
jgi:hypothetical protein